MTNQDLRLQHWQPNNPNQNDKWLQNERARISRKMLTKSKKIAVRKLTFTYDHFDFTLKNYTQKLVKNSTKKCKQLFKNKIKLVKQINKTSSRISVTWPRTQLNSAVKEEVNSEIMLRTIAASSRWGSRNIQVC
jgi:hypothetical protein